MLIVSIVVASSPSRVSSPSTILVLQRFLIASVTSIVIDSSFPIIIIIAFLMIWLMTVVVVSEIIFAVCFCKH